MGRVEGKLDSMIGDWHYRSVLIDWITEGAIGLEAESAQINASESERALIDDEMLSEARARIGEHTGRQVTLTLSDSQPLKLQGVVLTAADGRTAFNNQIKTRILRSQRKIQALIYDTLFAGNREE
jgi:vacuolar-type H+-ATPase subunit E/Vma4